MSRRVLSTALNFFLPGLGWLVAGRRIPQSIAWIAGFSALTYVEFGIQVAAPSYYPVMFGAVLLINAVIAHDTWTALAPTPEPAASGGR
jgi:hypothetical protein